MHAFAAIFNFAERLWTAQQESAEDSRFAATEIQRLGNALAIFRNATIAGDSQGKTLFAQAIEGIQHCVVIEVQDGLAIRFLVTRVHKGIERKRVILGCGDLFLHQRAENSRLSGIQQNAHIDIVVKRSKDSQMKAAIDVQCLTRAIVEAPVSDGTNRGGYVGRLAHSALRQ